jgi:hypothetical protein
MGKLSTIQAVLTGNANVVYVRLEAGDNFHRVAAKLREEAGVDVSCDPPKQAERCLVAPLLNALYAGKILVLDEIHYASTGLQVVLQEVVDTIAFQKIHRLHSETTGFGSIIVLGSLPMLVEEGTSRPLFRRFEYKVVIAEFSATELAKLFSALDITSPESQLAIYAAVSPAKQQHTIHVSGLESRLQSSSLFPSISTAVVDVDCRPGVNIGFFARTNVWEYIIIFTAVLAVGIVIGQTSSRK